MHWPLRDVRLSSDEDIPQGTTGCEEGQQLHTEVAILYIHMLGSGLYNRISSGHRTRQMTILEVFVYARRRKGRADRRANLVPVLCSCVVI